MEIGNTDAEGRLILADALSLAVRVAWRALPRGLRCAVIRIRAEHPRCRRGCAVDVLSALIRTTIVVGVTVPHFPRGYCRPHRTRKIRTSFWTWPPSPAVRRCRHYHRCRRSRSCRASPAHAAQRGLAARSRFVAPNACACLTFGVLFVFPPRPSRSSPRGSWDGPAGDIHGRRVAGRGHRGGVDGHRGLHVVRQCGDTLPTAECTSACFEAAPCVLWLQLDSCVPPTFHSSRILQTNVFFSSPKGDCPCGSPTLSSSTRRLRTRTASRTVRQRAGTAQQPTAISAAFTIEP